MSKVVSFKVSNDVKARMDKFRGKVNWSKLLRDFVIEKLKELEAKENLYETLKILDETKSVEKGFSARSVREDRDSG